eukprot:scaffold2566_cov125-Alexandrium_tamarense.AAC.15
MERLDSSNKSLKTSHDNHEREYKAQIDKLDDEEKRLKQQLAELDTKKNQVAQANGDVDVSDDDLVEVNAGGKIIAAKRATLTQLKGTRLAALFSGRWDKKLQRDGDGRIFLDVNPVCFQAIVDYVNELKISSSDSPPSVSTVDEELDHILMHQLELFGLTDVLPMAPIPESTIITTYPTTKILYDWLDEDNSSGDFKLLYRSSRDGMSSSNFHSKCDDKGSTLTVIQTTDGFVLGGYSNGPWGNHHGHYGSYRTSSKAFLFALSGGSITPSKMKLVGNFNLAIYCHSSSGPAFGENEIRVSGSNVSLHCSGTTYESWPAQLSGTNKTIKEMEVFQVSGEPLKAARKQLPLTSNTNGKTSKQPPVSMFSKNINDAINEKWESLHELALEVSKLEQACKDEDTFVKFFLEGNPQDVISLNVCGSPIVTTRRTLQVCKKSSLAEQFSPNSHGKRDSEDATKWNPEDVVAWLNRIDGVSDAVVKEFEDNQVTGRELLALNNKEALMDFGVEKKGTIHLLLGEIRRLKRDRSNTTVLIEHSPYCFEKMIDFLRVEGSYIKGLVELKPEKPIVRKAEKSRFEKVVKHYFPGESCKMILG